MKPFSFIVFLLSGLIHFGQNSGTTSSPELKSTRELIASSSHFNFYADTENAQYWDSISEPLEKQFRAFTGLLDFGGAQQVMSWRGVMDNIK